MPPATSSCVLGRLRPSKGSSPSLLERLRGWRTGRSATQRFAAALAGGHDTLASLLQRLGRTGRIDEKSQIQALDRTAPILPMRLGLPDRATHSTAGTTAVNPSYGP